MSAAPAGDIVVLHVEDDPAFADLAGDMLERVADDITVRPEDDPERALDRLDEERIDCVVSDYDMPGLNGLELLETIRREHPNLPFVLFTAKGSEEIASRAISAGVDDYIRKQAGTDCYEMLANRVRSAVKRHRSEERYHNLVDMAPVPIALFGSAGTLRYVNDAAVTFLEANAVEPLLGTPMPEFVHPDDRERATGRFERVLSEDRVAPRTELRLLTVEGTAKRATLATAPGYYHGEKVAQVVVRMVET